MLLNMENHITKGLLSWIQAEISVNDNKWEQRSSLGATAESKLTNDF